MFMLKERVLTIMSLDILKKNVPNLISTCKKDSKDYIQWNCTMHCENKNINSNVSINMCQWFNADYLLNGSKNKQNGKCDND